MMKLIEIETTSGERPIIDLTHATITPDPFIQLKDGTCGDP